MSTGSSRPGGLTTLAVLNFVLSGFKGLKLLTIIAFRGLAANFADENDPNAAYAHIELLTMALDAIIVVLLVVSGVGYIMQKKILGRLGGVIYGGLEIGNTVIIFSMLPYREFGIGSMTFLVYPAVTLLLLNTTFREDFVNP